MLADIEDRATADVRIAVVTSSPSWGRQMADRLEAEGYCVTLGGGDDAGALVDGCHLAIVDTAMATPSASAVLADLRERSAVPILAVSPADARSSEILDAYEAGADQMVAESVGPSELVARVRALLRRTPPQAPDDEGQPVELGSIRIDPTAGVIVLAGEQVALTTDELAIAIALVRRPGRVVGREELARQIPGCHPGGALDSIIRQLRAKVEAVEGWRRIETVRAVGFRFAADAERSGRGGRLTLLELPDVAPSEEQEALAL